MNTEIFMVFLIVGIFFFAFVLMVSMEAVMRNNSEKNLKKGIENQEQNKVSEFPPSEIEKPKKNE